MSELTDDSIELNALMTIEDNIMYSYAYHLPVGVSGNSKQLSAKRLHCTTLIDTGFNPYSYCNHRVIQWAKQCGFAFEQLEPTVSIRVAGDNVCVCTQAVGIPFTDIKLAIDTYGECYSEVSSG